MCKSLLRFTLRSVKVWYTLWNTVIKQSNMRVLFLLMLQILNCLYSSAQKSKLKVGSPEAANNADTAVKYILDPGDLSGSDTTPTINLNDVTIVSFKTKEDWMMYYKYKSRIRKVLPYVKIAKQLYAELQEEKSTSKKREYRHYRKDLEKEMRAKFEKELKDLNTGQGEMLFKLINRETGNNAYEIIKQVKGGFNAWIMQQLARRWGYNLKDKYDPKQEKMIEMIIKELGAEYKI